MAENKNLDKIIFEDSEDVCMDDLMKSYDKASKVECGQELDVVIM
jgi:hypothetical protein